MRGEWASQRWDAMFGRTRLDAPPPPPPGDQPSQGRVATAYALPVELAKADLPRRGIEESQR
jgi:hypothetical protein